ncbi:hypothetical protein EJ06DRAFT_119385 [Trichodelitschia bisporula]|uniref:Uncharacterized protein n=1 Tax=Trichodelitschia bisporula TaxID=703511 RepID=A0A6G1HQ11_9PEZI|nr:hypothetical protein EJ06DRAFT_119385 [Trichodelitschia bisporula]
MKPTTYSRAQLKCRREEMQEAPRPLARALAAQRGLRHASPSRNSWRGHVVSCTSVTLCRSSQRRLGISSTTHVPLAFLHVLQLEATSGRQPHAHRLSARVPDWQHSSFIHSLGTNGVGSSIGRPVHPRSRTGDNQRKHRQARPCRPLGGAGRSLIRCLPHPQIAT